MADRYSNMGVTPAQQGASGSMSDALSKKLKPIKRAKAMLKADVEALEQDPQAFGMSQSEKDAQIAQAQGAASAQRQGAQRNLARQALGGQEFQAGTFEAAQNQIAEQAGATAAQASAAADQMSRQMIERESTRIRAELDAARARKREDNKMIAQMAMQGAQTAAAGATGGLAAAGGAAAGTTKTLDNGLA